MMRRLRQLSRMLTIQRVLMKHGLDEIVWRTHLFRPLAWLGRLLSLGRRREPLGVRLRKALEELGPIFVKFGQALSVRPDLLPHDIAAELAKLQDQVPPFAAEQAAAVVEAAFGRPAEQVFAAFERTPLAAASIAQVHAARLPDGRDVVVKILRPNVRALIQRDIEVLYAIAGLAERYWPEARRLHPVEVVAEFERTLTVELDLMREAANASQLERNFAGSELLHVPEVHWDYCRQNVLTIERIVGIRVDEDVAGMHVGVKEVVAKYLREKDLHAVLGQPLDVGAGVAQRFDVVALDAEDALHRHDVLPAVIPIDLGHVQ